MLQWDWWKRRWWNDDEGEELKEEKEADKENNDLTRLKGEVQREADYQRRWAAPEFFVMYLLNR